MANATVIAILWMRHGLSCANVLDGCSVDQAKVDALATPAFYDLLDAQLAASRHARRRVARRRGVGARRAGARPDCEIFLDGGARARLHDLYRDPALTDCAVAASARAGAALAARVGAVDLVLSSPLRRARETAAAAFPGRHVREAPFVVERPHTVHAVQLDNEPAPPGPDGGASLFPRGVARNASDWRAFLGFLGSAGLDALENGGRSAPRPRPYPAAVGARARVRAAPDYTVVVVGHGDMMKHVCRRDVKPANNAVLRRRVLVDAAGVVHEDSAPCDLVLDAPPQVDDGFLTAADVARCADPWPVGPWLDLAAADDEADAAAASPCLAAARRAFPAPGDEGDL